VSVVVWGCGVCGCVVVWVGVGVWGCGGFGGVGLWGVWWCGGVGVGGGFPLRSNIPRSALCATLDTYNFKSKYLLLGKVNHLLLCMGLH
jgi:hypothetical protein